jgi:hypothetical protein
LTLDASGECLDAQSTRYGPQLTMTHPILFAYGRWFGFLFSFQPVLRQKKKFRPDFGANHV